MDYQENIHELFRKTYEIDKEKARELEAILDKKFPK